MKNFIPTDRNLTPRENVLIYMGAECGRCGYSDSLDPLVVRVPGMTQNRKVTNHSQYWFTVMGKIQVGDTEGIEVLCRNCIAIEMAEARRPKEPEPAVYVFYTSLPESTFNNRQQWLDELEEPKRVYILHPDYQLEYKGSVGKRFSISHLSTLDSLTKLDGELVSNRLHRVVGNKLEVV